MNDMRKLMEATRIDEFGGGDTEEDIAMKLIAINKALKPLEEYQDAEILAAVKKIRSANKAIARYLGGSFRAGTLD